MAPIVPYNPKASRISHAAGSFKNRQQVDPNPTLWMYGYPARHIKSQIDKLVYMTNLPRETWKFGRNRLNILALKRPVLRRLYGEIRWEHHRFARLKRVIDVWKDQQKEGRMLDFEDFGLESSGKSEVFRKVVAGYLLATQYTRDLEIREMVDEEADMDDDYGELKAELKRGLDLME